MQSHDESNAKKGLPAWFSAVGWSFIGILAAILTICVLSASLLWLLRWTNQATRLTNLTPVSTVTGTIGNTPESASSISTPFSTTPGSGEVSSSQNQGDSSAAATLTATTEPVGSATTSGVSAGTLSAVEQASATETVSAQSTGSQTPGAVSASTVSVGLSAADLTATAALNPTPNVPELTSTATSSPTPTRTATAAATDTPTPTRTATATATETNTPTPTPTPEPEPQVYIIQRDDWLSKLADKFYADILAYPAIVAATNAKAAEDDSFTVINDPDIIEIGQKLWIPTPAEAEKLLKEEQ